MHKTLLLILVILAFMPSVSGAQGAHEGLIRFSKADRPGTVADYPYSKEVVAEALRSHFEHVGLGGSKSEKGFATYIGTNWTEISPDKVEVYYKVDGKGNQSTVMMIVSKGYDNYVSSASDPAMEAKVKAFLDGLKPDIDAVQLRMNVAAQEDAVRRAEKSYKDADEDGNRLTRKKEDIDKQIADNAAEKQKRGDALAAEKSKLDQMKAMVK